MARAMTKAVAYLRTSSTTNVGPDKDSDKRQLAAIAAYAKANGFAVVDTYYDAAVSGADPVTDRPGFAEMLERLLSNGARTIIVESPDRFARDLMVQLAGHDMLKATPRPPSWSAKSWEPSRNSRKPDLSPSWRLLGSGSASRTANVRAARASPRRTPMRWRWPRLSAASGQRAAR